MGTDPALPRVGQKPAVGMDMSGGSAGRSRFARDARGQLLVDPAGFRSLRAGETAGGGVPMTSQGRRSLNAIPWRIWDDWIA